LKVIIPRNVMRKYLGEGECIFAMEAKGKVVYRGYNPKVGACHKEVPRWLGREGESVIVTIRKISTIKFIEAVNRAGLPFKVKVDPSSRFFIVIGSREIPLEATEVQWGGGVNIACMLLTVKDVAGDEHIIKVRYNGYETPEAVLPRKSGIRLIVDVHYIEERDALVVIYRRGVKGEKISRHEIRLGTLNIEKAKEHLRERGLKNEAVINTVVRKYSKVIGYGVEEARTFDCERKGLYGEWKIVEHDSERVLDVKHEVRDENGNYIAEVDVLETDRLVDAKFWNEGTFRECLVYKGRYYQEMVNEAMKYRRAMDVLHKDKVCIIFVDHINDELFEKGKWNILKELVKRADNVDWIYIINSMENIVIGGGDK